MGAAQVALPTGFVLDNAGGLPPGFELDAPANAPAPKKKPEKTWMDTYRGDPSAEIQSIVNGASQGVAGIGQVAAKALPDSIGKPIEGWLAKSVKGGNMRQAELNARSTVAPFLSDAAKVAPEAALTVAAPETALGRIALGAAVNTAAGVAKPVAEGEQYNRGDPSRMAKDASLGAIAGAVPEIVSGVMKGAAAVEGAASTAANATKDGVSNLVKGIGRKSAEEWGAVGSQLKDDALSTLQAANKNGTVIKGDAAKQGIQNIIDDTRKGVTLTGASADVLYPNTKAFLADLSSYDGDLSLENVHQIRQVGSSLISKAFRNASPEDAYALRDVVGKLDDWVSGLGKKELSAGSPDNIQTFNDFRDKYAQFARFDKVQKALEFAHGDINKVRTTVQGWFKPGAQKQLAGFSDADKANLKAFAFPSKGEQALGLAGKFGVNLDRPDKSSVVGSLGLDSLLGIAAGLKTGGTALVGGTIAKTAANRIAQGKLETSLKSLSGK
jgi:hypothetical protein